MVMNFTLDNLYGHLNLKVLYYDEGERVIYNGPVPAGKVDDQPEWELGYPDEYGEHGRLYYEGEGEYTLVMWVERPEK